MSELNREAVVAIDLFNIMIPARDAVCEKRRTFYEGQETRIHLANLYRYAHADRPVRSAALAAARRPSTEALLPTIRGLRPEIQILHSEPETRTNKEVTVDDDLIAFIDAGLADEPATLVLLTGDGARRRGGEGFLAAAQRVAAHGWGIELLCWDRAVHPDLRRFVREYPNGLYLPLEDVIDSVTFVQGGRRSTGLSLTARHLAAPAPTPRPEVPRGHAQATTAINVSRDRALDVLTEMQQEHLIGSARLDETGQPTWQLSATDIAAVVQRFGGAA